MARRKTPETSKIARVSTVAYARKQKPGADADGPDDDGPDDTPKSVDTSPTKSEARPTEAVKPAVKPSEPAKPDPARPSGPAEPVPPSEPVKSEAEPAAPHAEVWPEATPRPRRAQAETISMPVTAPVGSPPEVPAMHAEIVESPTHMPGPRDIPPGSPDDPAPPPGRVPSGDSRSLRKRDARYEFVLIYRLQTFVISRFGIVGTRGQWRVVEYPTPAAASHAYAKECSRFVSEGFSDYRE